MYVRQCVGVVFLQSSETSIVVSARSVLVAYFLFLFYVLIMHVCLHAPAWEGGSRVIIMCVCQCVSASMYVC